MMMIGDDDNVCFINFCLAGLNLRHQEPFIPNHMIQSSLLWYWNLRQWCISWCITLINTLQFALLNLFIVVTVRHHLLITTALFSSKQACLNSHIFISCSLIKILQLVCYPLPHLSLAYPMIIHTPLVSGNFPIKTLVAKRFPTSK